MTGKELYEIRTSLGYKSRDSFSKKINIPVKTYKAYEEGQEPVPGSLGKLMEELEIKELRHEDALRNAIKREIRSLLQDEYDFDTPFLIRPGGVNSVLFKISLDEDGYFDAHIDRKTDGLTQYYSINGEKEHSYSLEIGLEDEDFSTDEDEDEDEDSLSIEELDREVYYTFFSDNLDEWVSQIYNEYITELIEEREVFFYETPYKIWEVTKFRSKTIFRNADLTNTRGYNE